MGKIYVAELKCYVESTEEQKHHKLVNPNASFDLDKLPLEEVRKELEEFIRYRGEKLSVICMRTEIGHFNEYSRFINSVYPEVDSLKNVDLDTLLQLAKKWLIKEGKPLGNNVYKKERDAYQWKEHYLLSYLRKVHSFINRTEEIFSFEDDVWNLDLYPVPLRMNPTNRTHSISFEKITQETMRKEVKVIIHDHLTYKAVGTVLAEMTAVNNFSQFLSERMPQIQSMLDVTRDVIEEYLVFIHVELEGPKNDISRIKHLKSVFTTAAGVFRCDMLQRLFFREDVGKAVFRLPETRSDTEILRLNQALVAGDRQMARLFVLDELLGGRISETLALKADCLRKDAAGRWCVKYEQFKSRKISVKAVTDEVARLIQVSLAKTKKAYGDTEYIFVCDKNPKIPMQYSYAINYLRKVIRDNDIRDDRGERLEAHTHVFRASYATRLAEMGYSDLMIAKLLGQTGTGSVKHYRMVRNHVLADETREFREKINGILEGELGGTWIEKLRNNGTEKSDGVTGKSETCTGCDS